MREKYPARVLLERYNYFKEAARVKSAYHSSVAAVDTVENAAGNGGRAAKKAARESRPV
jgi:hypothetical protein